MAKLERRPLTQESTVENNIARSEIDSHANTCCFGANFTPLYFTGLVVCGASPFSDEYDSMSNVEVCATAKAWDNPIMGHASVLEFYQGLWFGSKLPNSLINPTQCRLFGISLCDDPFDRHRKIEMYDTETGTVIPLAMHCSTCHFKSRVPTKLELDTLPQIVMTSNELWDPASLFQQHSLEEEAHTRLVSSIKINQRTANCNPSEAQMEPNDPESDRLLIGISLSLTLETNATKDFVFGPRGNLFARE